MHLRARGIIRGRGSEQAVAGYAITMGAVVKHLADAETPIRSPPVVEPYGINAVSVVGGNLRGDERDFGGSGPRRGVVYRQDGWRKGAKLEMVCKKIIPVRDESLKCDEVVSISGQGVGLIRISHDRIDAQGLKLLDHRGHRRGVVTLLQHRAPVGEITLAQFRSRKQALQ